MNKIDPVLVQNELNKRGKLIPTKGLTKDLISNYSILNKGKYFVENGSQKHVNYFLDTLDLGMLELAHGCQKDVRGFQLHLQQNIVLI